MSDTTPDDIKAGSEMNRHWNYRPDVPIQGSPFLSWPPQPIRMIHWVRVRWFAIAENSILTALAFAIWFWASPSLEETRQLRIGWIMEIWLRNIALMIAVAGGLHLYFHTWRKQKQELKFDPREMSPKGRVFTFNSQLRDNIFWTLAGGVTSWTAYEVLMFWAMANGYAPVLDGNESPVVIAVILFLTPVWISFHFYWIHRALHWPPLYRLAHALHHRNTNIGPWSGLSMHPVETVMFLSSVLIHWVVASHPVNVIFHLLHQALTAATSHTGFEGVLVKDKNRLHLGNFHHQMHHRYFECNYGNLEVPWDKVFGSFHDGTDESHEKFKERRKRLMGQ
ncbi:MAG: sterol desaturase family protein [Pseudomonadota bacterium]